MKWIEKLTIESKEFPFLNDLTIDDILSLLKSNDFDDYTSIGILLHLYRLCFGPLLFMSALINIVEDKLK